MKRSEAEIAQDWDRSRPSQSRTMLTPWGDFARATGWLNLAAILIVGVATMAIRGEPPPSTSMLAILGFLIAMTWALSFAAFLLARAVSRLVEAVSNRGGRRAIRGALWDRWIDESPDLFR